MITTGDNKFVITEFSKIDNEELKSLMSISNSDLVLYMDDECFLSEHNQYNADRYYYINLIYKNEDIVGEGTSFFSPEILNFLPDDKFNLFSQIILEFYPHNNFLRVNLWVNNNVGQAIDSDKLFETIINIYEQTKNNIKFNFQNFQYSGFKLGKCVRQSDDY